MMAIMWDPAGSHSVYVTLQINLTFARTFYPAKSLLVLNTKLCFLGIDLGMQLLIKML